jgi:hypothetical protein
MQARTTNRRGGNPALRLAAIRRFHSYIAVFIAPSILFFAFTGSLQLFGLHEAHPPYAPTPLIESLGRVHRDQVFNGRPKRPAPAVAPAAHVDAGPTDQAADHQDAAPAAGGAQAQGVSGGEPAAMASGQAPKPDQKPTPKPATVALKWFFLLVAVGLITSTLLGLWMALAHNARKGLLLLFFLIGAAIPAVLTLTLI